MPWSLGCCGPTTTYGKLTDQEIPNNLPKYLLGLTSVYNGVNDVDDPKLSNFEKLNQHIIPVFQKRIKMSLIHSLSIVSL